MEELEDLMIEKLVTTVVGNISTTRHWTSEQRRQFCINESTKFVDAWKQLYLMNISNNQLKETKSIKTESMCSHIQNIPLYSDNDSNVISQTDVVRVTIESEMEIKKYIKEQVYKLNGEVKPWRCKHCPTKHFVESGHAKQHVARMHTTEEQKIFKCNKCSASFAMIGFLNFHSKTKHN